jgi:hypothetical protein
MMLCRKGGKYRMSGSKPRGAAESAEPRPQAKAQAAILAACACAIALLAGCATIPTEVLETEPAIHLDKTPQVYARLSGPALRDIASTMDERDFSAFAALLSADKSGLGYSAAAPSGTTAGTASAGLAASAPSPSQAMISPATLKSFFARTRTFGVGIGGIGQQRSSVEAVFVGDFPVLSVRLALASDDAWTREKDGSYRSDKYPLFIRTLQPGVIHASNEKAAYAAGAVEAYPKRAAALASSDVFIAANEPSAFLSETMPMEAFSLPINTIVLSGDMIPPATGGDSQAASYLLEVRIFMKDEASARAFKPVVRFLWTAAARQLFGAALDAASAPLTLEGDVYLVKGIEADALALRSMLTSPLLAGR